MLDNIGTLLRSKYFKAAGLYTIASIFHNGINLLLLPIITRLLSTSSYGVVSTYNSWVGIMTVAVGLQLYLTLRTAWNDKKADISRYISSIAFLIMVSGAVFFVTGFVLSITVLRNLPSLLIYLCVIHAMCNSLVNLELQREMMALEYLKRTLMMSLPSVIAALVGITLLYLVPETEYYGRIVPMAGVVMIVASYSAYNIFKRGSIHPNKAYWKYGFTFSLPLVFHGLASTILSGLDFTMITALRSSAETGVYSVAYSMSMVVLVITSSLESVWIPWFTTQMNDGRKEAINQVARRYMFIGTGLCASAMLCLPEVFKLFTASDYWGGIKYITPVVLASYIMFLYSLSVDVEYYYKSTKMIALNTIVAAVVNVVLNFIFIPKYGAMAAAFTTVASYAVSYAMHYVNARRIDPNLYPVSIYWLPIVLAILASVFTMFVESWMIRWGLAVMLIAVLFNYGLKFMKQMKTNV